MANKQFKAESKQLLDLMIHSIYSNKEVFLRELLSNAADALNKRYFYDLQNGGVNREAYGIQLSVNKENRQIVISDTGIGMDKEDADKYLGTIAHSGTKAFIESIENEQNKVDAIGQFGVGFYSSFIVSDKVTVESKKTDCEAIVWESEGVDSYSLKKGQKETVGTSITLHLRAGEEFDTFLETFTLRSLVKKYSDYIPYPIRLEETREVKKEDSEEMVTEQTNDIINAQKAIWKKAKSEVTLEDKQEFYKNRYFDFENPIMMIDAKLEGVINYDLLAFIPAHKPFDYYSGQFKKGLDLYSKEILIEEKAEYLLPDYLNFVRGVVDCADLNLNISREMLQKDGVVTKLTQGIEKKIISELKKLQKNDFESYVKFWETFGREMTFGVYADYGMKKDLLQDLLIFKSSKDKAYTSLAQYVENNKEQDVIYYVSGNDVDVIDKMPAMEPFAAKGIEVLYFLNDVDEFAIQMLMEYGEKKFQSITNADIDMTENKAEVEEKTKSAEALINLFKETLKDEVTDVKLTDALKTSAVRLSTKDGLSIEMEKTLAQMPGNTGVKSDKVLEINMNHPIFSKIETLDVEKDKETLANFASVLYQQARLVEGLPIEDPIAYTNLVNTLLV